MFYEKKEQEGLPSTQSPQLREETYTSEFFQEDYDNDVEKRLDETDFINPFKEDFDWIDMFRIERILAKINDPSEAYSANLNETKYETYNYESNAEKQLPYVLKVFNQFEDEEETLSPLELMLPKKEDEEKILVLRTPEPEEEHNEEDQEERRAA